jgi:hypothetical protein
MASNPEFDETIRNTNALFEGTMASAALPLTFQARQITTDSSSMFYVDGGVREVVPEQPVAPRPPFADGLERYLIQPAFEVHETTQIDPGLIRINMAYGYLRGFNADQLPQITKKEIISCQESSTGVPKFAGS